MADEPFLNAEAEQAAAASRERAAERAEQAAEDMLRAEVDLLKAELASLKAYVLEFKGDGSGVEFKGNVASLRLRAQPQPDGGAAFSLRVQDEGTVIAGAASTLNFVGAGVTATAAGTLVTITVTATPVDPLVVQEDDSQVVSGVTTINFTGEGVDVTDTGGGSVEVNIPGTNENYTEATYIMVQVQLDGTLQAHEVTISGNDLGEYVES